MNGGRQVAEVTGAAPTIASAFDPRRNSLNFLRLLFATLVLVTHTLALGGFGLLYFGHYDPGALGVDGFFVVSGFLITSSRLAVGRTGRYLWHRFLRICPGLWVCLLVTAAVCGPLAYHHDHGTLAGYLTSKLDNPVRYVVVNSALQVRQWGIAGTPAHVAWPPPSLQAPEVTNVWNGSLWTLWWEGLCYLGIAALAVVGILQRRRVLVLALTALDWLAVVVHAAAPSFAARQLDSQLAIGTVRFSLLFLSGACVYLYRDRIPVRWPLALASFAVVTGSLWLHEPHLLMDPPLAYLCLWLGIRLPLHRVGARRDLSYGLYIYAMPVQQLLATYGLARHGVTAYFAGIVPLAVLAAYASNVLVEKPALRLKEWTPEWLARRQVGRVPPPPPVPYPAERDPFVPVTAVRRN